MATIDVGGGMIRGRRTGDGSLDIVNKLFDSDDVSRESRQRQRVTTWCAMTHDLNDRQRPDAVRRFNRFYTQHIGVLDDGWLESEFSLSEARVLYELAHREAPTASELVRDLSMDPGYISRILRKFHDRGLVEKRARRSDARQTMLRLTERGRKAFAPLDLRTSEQVSRMLGALSRAEQDRLLDAMHTIETVLVARPARSGTYVLRPHQPGDMGWIVHRHGVLYAQEYGWDETFEALAASIAAEFIRKFDPKRERCWIAEKDGEIVGSVFLVRKSKTVAKLRLLLVEPRARGLGVGSRLVSECITFARRAEYKKMTLWTQETLHAARAIYARAGFRLVQSEAHHSFGKDLVGETWELAW
jgi:DNA-binding MarR family transcriptional regulator/GNAT superfamily N-acetyltransferase